MNHTAGIGILEIVIVLGLIGLVIGGMVLISVLIGKKETRTLGVVLLCLGGLMVMTVPVLLAVSYANVRTSEVTRIEAPISNPPISNPPLVSTPSAPALPASPVNFAVASSTTNSTQFSMRLSWLRITVVIAAVALVVLTIRHVVNHGGMVGFALTGMALIVLGLFAMRFAERQSNRSRPAVAISRATAAETEAAWEEITRPRITLTEEEIEKPVDLSAIKEKVTVTVANGDGPEGTGGPQVTVEKNKVGETKIKATPETPVKDVLKAIDEAQEEVAEVPNPDIPEDYIEALNKKSLAAREKSNTNKPDWVNKPPKWIGTTYRRVLESGPFASDRECQEDQREQLLEASAEYLKNNGERIDPSFHRPNSARFFGVSDAELAKRFLRDEHWETTEASVGRMKTLYTLLEIDSGDGEWLVKSWQQKLAESQREESHDVLSFLAVGTMLLLGTVFGLLKTDEWTQGKYTKRLLIGVPAAIIGSVLLLVILNLA